MSIADLPLKPLCRRRDVRINTDAAAPSAAALWVCARAFAVVTEAAIVSSRSSDSRPHGL